LLTGLQQHRSRFTAANAKELRLIRAIEILERARTTAARQLLQELADGVPGAKLTQQAQAALQRLPQETKAPG
jgi:hypothetical protein